MRTVDGSGQISQSKIGIFLNNKPGNAIATVILSIFLMQFYLLVDEVIDAENIFDSDID